MTTTDISTKTIAEIVATDYRTAEVFKKHGIDFCCGGKKTVKQVCIEKQVNLPQLQKEIDRISVSSIDPQHRFNEWSLSFLADYITNVHHSYVNNNLALIAEFADKVALVHGMHNPETREIADCWKQLTDELKTHMSKEELILFPYIRNLERFDRSEIPSPPQAHFGTIKNPIRMMEHEHDHAGSILKRIENLSSHFIPPAHACNTYRILYAKLKEFQNDLFKHIHLENNILFPKAIELEQQLSSNTVAK